MRGKHSNDHDNFSPKMQARLHGAVLDLSYLLGRGYGEKSALQLVGNRYSLNVRQQMALGRIAVGEDLVQIRKQKQLQAAQIAQQSVSIDGYNLLIGLEVALSNGFLFLSQDGCYRDIASIHGTYRSVEATVPALLLLGQALRDLGASELVWYFDAPVSNSGRLKTLMYQLSTEHGFGWQIELVNNPDKTVAESGRLAISSDGWVLDNSPSWFNMLAYLIETQKIQPEVLDFCQP